MVPLNNSKLAIGEGTNWGRKIPAWEKTCLRMGLGALSGGTAWSPGISFGLGQ